VDEPLLSRPAKGIVALVAANLAWNVGISRCLRSEDVQWAMVLVALLFVAIGTLAAQTFVVAVWMAFSEGRWPWRWVVPAHLLIALSMACGLAAGADPLYAASLALPLAVLLGILVALLLPLRRAGGWRLTARQDATPGERGRCRISDLLIWMAVIALPLAIVRWFATLPGNEITTGMRAILVSVALLLPLLWLVLLVAFAPRERRMYLLAGATVYDGAATGLAVWFIHPLVEPLLWPLPGWFVVLISAAFFASGAMVMLLCCLALRAFGYRLLRPAWALEQSGGETGVASPFAIDHSRPSIE
jgi:hypothetical protein